MPEFDIARSLSCEINITWKIENFCSLVCTTSGCSSAMKDFSIDSPPFAIEDETWCLRMHQQKEDKFTKLSLVRLESNNFSQYSVTYVVIIKNKNDYTYDDYGQMCKCESVPPEKGILNFEENENLVTLSPYLIFCDDILIGKDFPDYLEDDILTLLISFNNVWKIQRTKKIDVSTHRENIVPVEGHVKLVQDLKTLLLSEIDSDVTIRVKEREFPVHRAIIGVRSPVFAAMLRSEMKEKSTGFVDIHDLDPDAFLVFLSFLYTGCIDELSTINVFGVYKAADMYDVGELKSNCLHLMKHSLSVDSFCDVVSISLLHDEKDLLRTCISYFSQNMVKILETAKWQTFLSENPIQGNELMIKGLKKK